jgi:uncharacterized protein with ParB-like and HNH nuclease domain
LLLSSSANIDIFKPDNKTIKEIFGDTDAFYNMPIYQRPYAWDKERVEQLWYDLLGSYKNNLDNPDFDKNYFLGSVVVVDKGSSQDVVDGQQRLTTLTILFCTLRDLEIDSIEEKQSRAIKNSVQDLVEEKQRLKLTTHSNNQAVFEETIINKIDFKQTKKEIKDNKFLQTSYYFRDLINKSIDIENEDYVADFSGFIDYIFTKTTMIKVVCFDVNFAIKLFSVLNDRGLDLTSADIIKAYLMEPMVDDQTKLNSFIEVWKQIEGILAFTDETMHGILNLYLYFLKTENPKRSLQDELKQVFKDKKPQEIILDIKKFTENYNYVVSNTKDKHISMLKYLGHSIYWKSILTTAKQVKYSEFDKLKELITKYFYQSWIAEGTTNRIKQTAFTILRMVKNKIPIDDGIKSKIEGNLKKYKKYERFLNKEDLYRERWLKPILLSVEYFEHDEKEFIPIGRDIQIEHILPVSWNDKKLNWRDFFTKDEVNLKLNSLGNLTLLSGRKNIQASNRNYVNKVEIYKGNSGKGFDGKTSFEVTKSIIDIYPNWDNQSIDARHKVLKSKIKSILII